MQRSKIYCRCRNKKSRYFIFCCFISPFNGGSVTDLQGSLVSQDYIYQYNYTENVHYSIAARICCWKLIKTGIICLNDDMVTIITVIYSLNTIPIHFIHLWDDICIFQLTGWYNIHPGAIFTLPGLQVMIELSHSFCEGRLIAIPNSENIINLIEIKAYFNFTS